MIGVELVKDKKSKEPMDIEKMVWLIQKMKEKGVLILICGRYGQVIRFVPPLIITKEMLDKTFELFEETLKEFERRI
jgi:4-aminobutyrate aminotransferase-like enzyme